MGYTSFTISKIEPLLKNVTRMVDLGSQQNYAQPKLPAPYISEWYNSRGIKYDCIDLNGENGAYTIDLSKRFGFEVSCFLVVDAGTSEHIGKDGAFDWEAIYNCWANKHDLCWIGGIIYNENPKTGNWPGHGFNYYTQEFYKQLEATGVYKILELGEHPAMGNTTDGWNVYCILQKVKADFITLEDFKKLDLRRK